MKKPNIVLINCDDLGYGDLGCYGSQVNHTPHLDRMAEEGVRFTSFYQSAPVCSASRAALMTGCYSARLSFPGVLFPGQAEGLNPDEQTVANVLKGQGYATKIIGKWHCGDQPEFLPTQFGFDEYFGIPYSNDMGRQRRKAPRWCGENGPPPLPLLRNGTVIQQQPDQAALTERYVDESVRFMRDHRDEPFFLYFAHMYVHLPIYAPERFMAESENGRYGAGVACVDWAYGVIAHELKSLGLDQDTMVIFTSDNGSRARDEGGSNLPLRGTKGTIWEGGFRVPFIARWPEKIAAGTTSDALLASMDMLPTFATFAGSAPDAARPIDGLDCSDLLLSAGQSDAPRDTFLFYRGKDLCAVRKGKWKLMICRPRNDGEVQELYDLDADIGETNNVYGSNPNVVSELKALADTARHRFGDGLLDITGADTRPVGHVDNPAPLTNYNPNHPYIVAEYDLPHRG